MGSKKHKKHHKSEKKEQIYEERSEKPLRLVLKVSGGTASRSGTPSSDYNTEISSVSVKTEALPFNEPGTSFDVEPSTREYEIPRSTEKHKKSKKKKKKKSSEKDKEKKHKHHHHRRHHHHHHHKKSEAKVECQETECVEPLQEVATEVEPAVTQPESVKSIPEEAVEEVSVVVPPEPDVPPDSSPLIANNDNTSFQIMLNSLFKTLQKKDQDQFFAWPVSDIIAPGYSSIIQNPMDFSTMKEKLDRHMYSAFDEFKRDVKLICDNCMTYNRPETIYYKSAKRLSHSVSKMMSKERLLLLKQSLIASNELPHEDPIEENETTIPLVEETIQSKPEVVETPIIQLNIQKREAPVANIPIVAEALPPKKKPRCSTPEIKEFDDMTPSEILKSAQEAAKCAADKLTFRHPNSCIGFLRQKDNGSTSLAIVNSNGKIPTEREVNFGMLVGKLRSGTGNMSTFKEDYRNIAAPIKTLEYGPYCSFAPQYDSAFANLNKEETELVYSSYGDEIGVQFAESLIDFAHDSDYVTTIVDNLLDSLSNGEHSKTSAVLQDKKKLQLEEELMKKEKESTLASNEQNTEEMIIEGDSLEIQKKLDKTAELLRDLQSVQNDRLSQKLPSHLSLITPSTEKENEIAEQVQEHLKDLAQQVTPQSLLEVKTIRQAMGITPSFTS